MTDTQLPRFLVFQQEKDGQPHQYAGSVHAPDAEMALMNARDVFVRRPSCVSLWVAPASAVYTRTAEEQQVNPAQSDRLRTKKSRDVTAYHIFQKATHKGTYQYAGDVRASTPQQALDTAFGTIIKSSAFAWLVVPTHVVTRSTPQDMEIFQTAMSKAFRDQGFYHTVAALQEIRVRSMNEAADEA